VANGFGTINELQSGERQDAVLVERGLEGEVEAGERLDRRQLGHLYRHFNAAVFADRELFGEQGVDGFDGADFAAFDAAKSYIKDFQRARHLQADETRLDALDDGGSTHHTTSLHARRRPTAA
jgi:hypothetical protein